MDNKYVIYVGTTRGTLAYTQLKKGEKVNYELPDKGVEITCMEWGSTLNEIVVGHRDGRIKFYDTLLNKYGKSITISDGTPIVGVASVNDVVVSGTRDGFIYLTNDDELTKFSLNLGEKGTLDCLSCNSNRKNIVGTGGEFNDLKLWDIETKQCIFKAKSLGHDELNLPIPTSVRGISFFPLEDKLSSCATKEGHVLLYDERAQRRPVVKFKEPKASYTCICYAHRERQCVVGTTRGYMQMLDLKSSGKCLKTFKTFTGGVTSVICDSSEPVVISTSLDRFLRIHNLDTKELLHKEYMKQHLTKALFKLVVKEEVQDDEQQNENVDEEYEQMFETMETVLDVSNKKVKRKHKENEKISKKRKKKTDEM